MPSATLLPLAPPGWTPEPRRLRSGALVVVVHALVVLALGQSGRTAIRTLAPEPLAVHLIAERPPIDRPRANSAPRATATLPLPPHPAAVTLPPPEVPAVVTPSTTALLPPAVSPPNPQGSPTSAPPAAVTSPKVVPASALRYRVEPAVEVPRLSRRAGESGRVGLRVLFDTQGSPREIQLSRSSGFARLDAQALEAMQRARIQPIVEDGRPIEVIAQAWLEYELD